MIPVLEFVNIVQIQEAVDLQLVPVLMVFLLFYKEVEAVEEKPHQEEVPMEVILLVQEEVAEAAALSV